MNLKLFYTTQILLALITITFGIIAIQNDPNNIRNEFVQECNEHWTAELERICPGSMGIGELPPTNKWTPSFLNVTLNASYGGENS